jgi:hypothetical protein
MRSTTLKTILKTAILAVTVLLLTAGASFAQVSLTAQPTTITLPDGQSVPMWGLFCGSAVGATCTTMKGLPQTGLTWEPPLITVATGSSLTINLTNSLPASVPATSLMIVGQLGGGLGASPTRIPGPDHSTPQNATWPIAGDGTGPQFVAPSQGARVRSFGTEVLPAANTDLTWTALKPGTYLIESGTHPSIQGPMGLYGVLVVTNSIAAPAVAYPAAGAVAAVTYDKDVPLLLSEIDAVQNRAVDAAVNTAGFDESTVWSGQPGGCGNPTSASFRTCYPPAVNYDPRYYLVNGVAFDKTNPAASTFAGPGATTATAGGILLRFVNAGLRMHVPSVVGASMSLIAEDGNVLPGTPRIQNEVFLPAGKVYDVRVNPVAAGAAYAAATLPVFDRQLSLSTNNQRDGGMLAYIGVNGGGAPVSAQTAFANADSYFLVPGQTLTVSDPAKGVIANDVNVYGVSFFSGGAGGQLTFNGDGTFSYVPNSGTTSDSFMYEANGNPALLATVTLGACTGTCLGGAPVAVADSYTSTVASRIQISVPGVLANDTDPQGHPLKAVFNSASGLTVSLAPDGSFIATPTAPVTATTNLSFQYHVVNSQNTASAATTVTLTFLKPAGLNLAVKDAKTGTAITDYRWIVEEDRTFKINPACQVNTTPRPSGCPALPVPSLGTNFHTSYMPVVAAGCVGTVACESGQAVFDPATQSHLSAVCDIGNGGCRTSSTPIQQDETPFTAVALDPTKYYYVSILPGDAGNSFSSGSGGPQPVNANDPNGPQRPFSIALDCSSGPGGADFAPGTGTCGHTMGGAPITPAQVVAAATIPVPLEQTPLPTTKVAVFVFEDDSPLNGEIDVHGGTDALGSTAEPGLGGFEITLFDDAGGTGDATGQMTYDMFNMPLSNSLQGMIDPSTGFNACPISSSSTDGLVGMIVTCPKYEAGFDSAGNPVISPLVGQAVIAGLMPGRYGVVATPAADRIAQGEEWLQTNTLDGQKAHDSFIRAGGPAYFQEFGPAGYHVAVGFANPAKINQLGKDTCAALAALTPPQGCTGTVTGRITNLHYSRPPNENLYGSGSRASLGFAQCYVSLGDPDEADIAFAKCDSDGNFSFSGIPDGIWRLTVFDQWNDQIVDGLASAITLGAAPASRSVNVGDIAVLQWHTNIYTSTYFDADGNGVRGPDETGLTLLPTNIRFRDGSYSNFNNTDLSGNAGFNEVFPLFSWYVVESDTTRYKQTGVHVVYDAGGPVDCTSATPTCSNIAGNYANTVESTTAHIPGPQRIPGAVYCGDADCSGGISGGSSSNPSTGRIDPPWVTTEGWQGFSGQNSFIEFGKKPFAPGENGGIRGEVIYASTRPFDDPTLLIHTSWTPDVPNVTINLYQEGTAGDGTQTLTLVDHTKTTSWDDYAQGFHVGAGGAAIPNMNCPGQELDPVSNPTNGDPFYFTLAGSTQWLNPSIPLASNGRFKCYDGMHMFNQLQPVPYDGAYTFPSVTSRNATTGLPTGTNCTICITNPTGDGTRMLPAGKYVVEMVVPPGYELVKEEDKNILIGDNYIAPVTAQFGGLAYIFILPDQAEVNSQYNPNNPQNPTQNLGSQPRHEGDTGSVETFWPCAGQLRIVPDFISLFPLSMEVAPFAGASRHLCDRKEVTLEDQMSALAKFWVFSSTHVAAHFTGFILDDFSSEFDPYSPDFGEKFAVPNVPVSFKDFNGIEISRVYSDQWGLYNGLNYSTWEVNPPNPTGYAPTMMVTCMNDPGPIVDSLVGSPTFGQLITDPLYNPNYSQFCYENPFMPGQTQYMDTPIVPVSAFAESYNPPDCAYPDATPAIKSVNWPGNGPYVPASGGTLTITALGTIPVPNAAYSGPAATTAPYNQRTVMRNYHFGSTAGTVALVGSDGVSHTLSASWGDTIITATVPANFSLPLCAVQQRGTGNGGAKCGELVITTAPSTAYPNGQRSIDTVTVTIGGKAPTVLAAGASIQSALDNALPGDLIIVPPGTYNELLVMWKPVRLQGVGAASVMVNANTHPSGKMDSWRAQVNCLFGAAINGGLSTGTAGANPFDPTGTYSCAFSNPQVDPIPLEPVAGWDANLNGNLAELLQEPTLMGAYEGAGITVLGKGLLNPNTPGVCDGIDAGGCIYLTASSCSNSLTSTNPNSRSNFFCNPSRIDGMTFTNSSQGGGGIFVHGWNHNIEVSNNRVHGNAGTLSGGVVIGQVETPDGTISADGLQELALGLNTFVNVHNNAITSNAAYGDEINSTTPSAAGGATICTGSDNYKFQYNWVCGNLSTGDGGGLAHFGFSYNGNISNNVVLFNQSTNPTLPTYGGGIIAQGVPPDGTFCENSLVDVDCAPQLSDGVGPGLVIDSNLIMGNTAESGKGGGLRLQNANGTDVQRNPNNANNWYQITVTNNIIANNVAGWAGGGVSLQDAVRVNFVNNTVVSNDTTASAGVLFNTHAATQANVGPPNCTTVGSETTCQPITTSQYEPAGLETARHTSNLIPVFTNASVACPGEPTSTHDCTKFSKPVLRNDLFWQNRSFYISVDGLNGSIPGRQNLVTLHPTLNQLNHPTGYCDAGSGTNGVQYWDIGAFGDAGHADHGSGLTLAPQYSILTFGDYPSANNLTPLSNPTILEYCNGSRVPPEGGGNGYAVPPGISDAVLPNPLFTLMPAATPDEGNQWINMFYGPLSLANPVTLAPLGNYSITSSSPAFNSANPALAPTHDFFGNTRPQGGLFDIGAVEVAAAAAPNASVTGGPLHFGNVGVGGSSASQMLTLHNTGTATLNGINLAFMGPFSRQAVGVGAGPGSCGTTLTAGATSTCTINVVFQPTASGFTSGTVAVNASNGMVTGSPVTVDGTGVPATRTATLLPVTNANFGTVAVGGISNRDFNLRNTGNVMLTGIAWTLTTPGASTDYTIVAANTTCGTTLNPLTTCVIRVRFTPKASDAAGSTQARTLSVADSATASPQTQALTGVRQ